MSYAKLFASIVESTVWREPHETVRVWVTLLAKADQHGVVKLPLPVLADIARVTMEQCQVALDVFLAPDQWSRTKDHEGRRIAEIEGGWLLLNYATYRAKRDADDRREQARVGMANFRARQKGDAKVLTDKDVNTVGQSEPPLAQAEAEAEAKQNPLNPPCRGKSSSGRKPREGATPHTIDTFIASLNGGKVIEAGDPLLVYATEINLPVAYVKLAWDEFKTRMQSKRKLQKDWRATFRAYIRGNYLKLWYAADDGFQLTVAGVQAQRAQAQS